MANDSIEHEGHTLYRIRALVHIETLVGSVGVGELGGYIQDEGNLNQTGSCWIFRSARIYESAGIQDDAVVYNGAQTLVPP